MIQAKGLICLSTVAAMLAGCSKPIDAVFGTSYDSCMLRNHGNGTEDNVPTQACARHYVRSATKAEINAINTATKEKLGILVPNIAVDFDPKLPPEDHLEVSVTNPSSDLIINDVTVEADFFKDAAMKKLAGHASWDFDKLAIEPGDGDTRYGMFTPDRAPGPFAKSRVIAAKVISHAHG
jgi:hypothetical protein